MTSSIPETLGDTIDHPQFDSQVSEHQPPLRNKLVCFATGVITLFFSKMAITNVADDFSPFWLRCVPLSWLMGMVTLLHHACLPDSQPDLMVELCVCVFSYMIGVRAKMIEQGRN
jgi:hypothetical protein